MLHVGPRAIVDVAAGSGRPCVPLPWPRPAWPVSMDRSCTLTEPQPSITSARSSDGARRLEVSPQPLTVKSPSSTLSLSDAEGNMSGAFNV
jgi:hypothetical protein